MQIDDDKRREEEREMRMNGHGSSRGTFFSSDVTIDLST